MFASRFHPSVTQEMLQDYLKKKLQVDLCVESVKTRYDTYASFHITCVCENPSIFLRDDLWPENAYVRWWRESRVNRPARHAGNGAATGSDAVEDSSVPGNFTASGQLSADGNEEHGGSSISPRQLCSSSHHTIHVDYLKTGMACFVGLT